MEGSAEAVSSAAISPDGRFIATGVFAAFLLWDTTTGRATRFHRAGFFFITSFAPDGKSFLALAGATPLLWDTTAGKEVPLFDAFAPTGLGVLSPDGQSIFVSGCFWDITSGRRRQKHCLETDPPNSGMPGIRSAAFSPDGRLLATGSSTGVISVWEVRTGKELRRFSAQAGAIFSQAFSPDGRLLATATGDYSSPDARDWTAHIWDVKTGRVMQRLIGHTEPISSVAFSPDGRFLVTGSWDRTARLWNVTTGKEVRRFQGHSDEILSVAFSPDGRLLVTSSKDGTIRLWDITNGRELCRLISFADGTWVVVDADGRFDTNNLDNNSGLHWLMSDDPFTPLPLEIFMRDYYEPRLLPRILAGEKFRPVRSLAELNRVQPAVKLLTIEPQTQRPDTVAVTVEVARASREFARAGKKVTVATGVYDLRLFRDGQLVGYAPDPDGEIPVEPKTGTARQTFTVSLPHAKDTSQIEFSAYAFNVDRVKSATDRKVFRLPKELTPVKGRAYLITVGVNTYENPAWDLRFAANDARQMLRVLQEQLVRTEQYVDVVSVPLISDAELRGGERVVTDNHATKQNIQTVLQLLAGKPVDQERRQAIPQAQQLRPVRPEDLVLITFSSHGYADPNGIFYFFPFDIGAGQGRQITEALLRHAVSSDELSQWLREIDAGDLVLIVDACQSAATVESEGFKPGPMGSRGLRLSKKAFCGSTLSSYFVLILTALAGGSLTSSVSGSSPLLSLSSLG